MKLLFSFSFAHISKYIPRISLRNVLPIVWWVILAFAIAFLAADGFLFYLYGLGYVPAFGQTPAPASASLHEIIIKKAASIIDDSAARFRGDQPLPSGFHDPFK